MMPTLKELRIERGYAQPALAALAGVGKNTISRLENGDLAEVRTLRKLEAALGVEPGGISDIKTVSRLGKTGISRKARAERQ